MLDTVRIIPPLSTFNKRTGDLRLNDYVLSSVVQDATINAISSYLFLDSSSINTISSQVDVLSSSLSNYTKLSAFELSIGVLHTLVSELYAMIEDLSSKAIFYYLNNVSFLKAPADEPTNLCVWFYTSPKMDLVLSVSPHTGEPAADGVPVVFDSANEYDMNYIEALLVNNVEESPDSSIEYRDNFHLYENEHGTEWKKPISSDGAFGEEYNNAPVNFKLVEWALGKEDLSNWVGTFKKSTKLYAKYIWYYVLDGEMHASDVYSQVLPSLTEQTAPRPSDSENSIASLLHAVDWSEEIDGFGFEAYLVEPGTVNELVHGLDGDNYDCLYLDLYSPTREYKLKFTANADFTIGRLSVAVAGNGEYISDFDDYSTASFLSGKTYLISIQAGMVTTLALK